MGFNTTILVLNDRLHEIKKDKDFGAKLYDATLMHYGRNKGERTSFGPQATVVEQHHADCTSIIAVGGNCATTLGKYWGTHHRPEDKLRLLKLMADELGYCVRKKPKKKGI